MKSIIVAVFGLGLAVVAVPDPLITPRAELAPRQDDPALVGWVDAINGQFSESRSCDYPATLSSSGSLAQCCAPGSSCVFWSSCSAATLFAESTSLFCDQGYCNTAVVVPTVGASEGVSYLGCWATSYGQSAFTLVRDIGDATGAPSSTTTSGSASSSSDDSSASSATSTDPSTASSETSGSATESAGASASSGAAAVATVKPFTSVFGLVAVLFGLL